MRSLRIVAVAVLTVAALVAVALYAQSSVEVVFSPDTMGITPNADFSTPPIVVQNAGAVTSVRVNIAVPEGIVVDTSMSGAHPACVEKGSDVGALFLGEWHELSREIRIACTVNPGDTIEVVKSIDFSTGSGVDAAPFTLSGNVNNGDLAASFGELTLLSQRLVGDLDEDGDVDTDDAHVILQALFDEVAETAEMDVNQDGDVDLDDARWILQHRSSG